MNKIGEEGDFQEFETVDPKWITIKLKNGTVIQMKTEVTAVIFQGYVDPNNGQPTNYPIFSIQTQTVVRNQHIPRELILMKPASLTKDERSYR